MLNLRTENIPSYHFKKGVGDAIGDELLGLADAVIHPIDTFNNKIEAVSHPVETFNAIKQAISDSWNRDVTNGDSYSSAEWYGSAAGHTILAVGQLFVGTKGVDKIAMLNPGTKSAEISRTANQSLQDAAFVITMSLLSLVEIIYALYLIHLILEQLRKSYRPISLLQEKIPLL